MDKRAKIVCLVNVEIHDNRDHSALKMVLLPSAGHKKKCDLTCSKIFGHMGVLMIYEWYISISSLIFCSFTK